ncbi:MAG: hypothetical protein MI862_15425 [Desulfobacterales bacterium]|nr:hypothetical protein [Desulfobacterales bacterium]
MALQGTFFDATYYLTEYTDVAANWSGSPLDHYITFGADEGRAPNAWFDFQHYRANNADLQSLTALELFDHYEDFGYMEGRTPSATYANFDEEQYLADYADLGTAGITEATALNHFLIFGADEGRTAKNDDGTTIDGTGSSVGSTFALTTSIDAFTPTDKDDLFIGDFSGTSTMNAGDQINGGAGTDTLKAFGTFAAANMPVDITSIEYLIFAAPGDQIIDLTGYTQAATGIEKVVIEDASLMNSKTITTGAGQHLSLATGNTNTHTAGTVTWAGSSTDTSQNLTLNGYQGGSGATPVAFTITAAASTTLNLALTGAASGISTFTLGAVTDTLVVTGSQNFTVDTDLVSSGGATILKTVDASAATGNLDLTIAAATNAAFAFTGGSGDDTLLLADDGMAAFTAGSQLDGGAGTDKLGILDTALTTAEITALNAVQNFEILGLNAAITIDASNLTSFTNFSLDANGAHDISNMATGSTVSVTAAHAANIDLAGAVGVNDLTFNVGTASTGGLTLGGTVTIGQTVVALSSNGTGAGANVITNLANADNSAFTITGSNDLTISTTQATAIGSKYDGSAATGDLNITGNTAAYSAGSSLGDVFIGGSGADTFVGSLNSSTMTGNAGADTFDVSVAVAGATTNATITTVTDFTVGDKLEFAATAGAFSTTATDLSGAGTEQAAIDLLVAGNNSDIQWGTYNGFTYVADDVGAGASLAATDTVVKLVGTLDLSSSTFAANTITFA